MMVGCSALEGYVPEFDATVVTRLLDEEVQFSANLLAKVYAVLGQVLLATKDLSKIFTTLYTMQADPAVAARHWLLQGRSILQ